MFTRKYPKYLYYRLWPFQFNVGCVQSFYSNNLRTLKLIEALKANQSADYHHPTPPSKRVSTVTVKDNLKKKKKPPPPKLVHTIKRALA